MAHWRNRIVFFSIVVGIVPCHGARQPKGGPVMTVHMQSSGQDCERALDVRLWRQGKLVLVGRDFSFSHDSLYQEHVISIVANESVIRESPLFVTTSLALKRCGEQDFSQLQLTCPNSGITSEASANAHTVGLVLPSNRGFGVEFEFLARPLPSKLRVLLGSDDIANIKTMSHGSYADAVDNVVDNFGGLPLNLTVVKLKKELEHVPDILTMMQIPSLRNCFKLLEADWEPFLQTVGEWRWDADQTVSSILGGQTVPGIGFEVTSPILSENLGPVSRMLQGLAHLGVAAPKSAGLHIHINVASQNGPGELLTFRGIAQVWVAWVQYQLVIDEMLSPGRQGNEHANRHFLSTRDVCLKSGSDCLLNARLFENMFLHSSLESAKDIDIEGSDARRRGLQAFSLEDARRRLKYHQLNLESLFTYGTLEFRAHSATYDARRVLNWIHFLIRFVEHFGSPRSPTARFFLEEPSKLEAGIRYEELVLVQRAANITGLFDEIGLPSDMRIFYLTRAWEADSRECGVDEYTQARSATEVQGLFSKAQRDACH